MSETRICLVGATGMIGTTTIERAMKHPDIRITAIARRDIGLPPGARVDLLQADTPQWPTLIASLPADVLVCAIGTTRAKSPTTETYRAIDIDLVLAAGKAARAAGIERMIVVSAVGADTANRFFYTRTKGEMEQGLSSLGFVRLDILRPAQLVGPRVERRPLERVTQVVTGGLDGLLHGRLRRFRSIRSRDVADAILSLARERAPGRFVHEHDAIVAAARS